MASMASSASSSPRSCLSGRTAIGVGEGIEGKAARQIEPRVKWLAKIHGRRIDPTACFPPFLEPACSWMREEVHSCAPTSPSVRAINIKEHEKKLQSLRSENWNLKMERYRLVERLEAVQSDHLTGSDVRALQVGVGKVQETPVQCAMSFVGWRGEIGLYCTEASGQADWCAP